MTKVEKSKNFQKEDCGSSPLVTIFFKFFQKILRTITLHFYFMDSLFSASITPLASLLRPTKLDDYIGQKHLVGPSGPIFKFLKAGKIPSLILWGPPGVGKTSLARVIANSLDAKFFHLSGVLSKKDDVIKIIAKAQNNFHEGRQTILFLDEIHRWSKSQQDTLLPFVEK